MTRRPPTHPRPPDTTTALTTPPHPPLHHTPESRAVKLARQAAAERANKTGGLDVTRPKEWLRAAGVSAAELQRIDNDGDLWTCWRNEFGCSFKKHIGGALQADASVQDILDARQHLHTWEEWDEWLTLLQKDLQERQAEAHTTDTSHTNV